MVASGRDWVSHAGLFEVSTTERAAMSFDICPICDGTGERDFLSGAKCYECNGTGVVSDVDPDDEEYDDEEFHTLDPEDQKRNDAMERGDELRDRAKDENQ